jgi:hypothetical protein
MITARYHYKDQHDMAMKCADIFFSRKAFDTWYNKYKDQIKNLTTVGLR